MKRREFILALGGAAVAWPLAAHAQQPAMPVIGYLHSGRPEMMVNSLAGFRQGLSESGYVEGQNVAIEYRWAKDQHDQLPALAADLVGRKVTVIFASGGIISAQAAKAATATIPIIFTSGADPVAQGLVASLNRPGGNATGFSFLQTTLEAKRYDLLHELVPTAAVVAVLINPKNPAADGQSKDVEAAARAVGQQLLLLKANSNDELDAVFTTLVRNQRAPLVVASDPFFLSRRNQLVALATRHAIPAIYEWREFAEAGGLMSYGTDIKDANAVGR